jgi:hypothetical protein
MLEQAATSTMTLTLECVSPRSRMHAVGRTGRRSRGLAAWAHAWIPVLAAALLTLGSGCSLLLDFDVPPLDAARPIDAGPSDAAPADTGPIDAGGPDAAPGTDSMQPDLDAMM